MEHDPTHAAANASHENEESNNTAQNKENAQVHDDAHAVASRIVNDLHYKFTPDEVSHFFETNDFRVPVRTIQNYCKKQRKDGLVCKKFPSDGQRKWFITEESVHQHLAKLIADGATKISESADASGRKNVEQGAHAVATESDDVENNLSNSETQANAKATQGAHAVAKNSEEVENKDERNRTQSNLAIANTRFVQVEENGVKVRRLRTGDEGVDLWVEGIQNENYKYALERKAFNEERKEFREEQRRFYEERNNWVPKELLNQVMSFTRDVTGAKEGDDNKTPERGAQGDSGATMTVDTKRYREVEED